MASTPARVGSVTPPSARMSRTSPAASTAGAKATRSPFTSAAVALGTFPVATSTTSARSASRTATSAAPRTSLRRACAAQVDTRRMAAPRAMVTNRDQSVSGAATWKATETRTRMSTIAKP